MNSGATHLERLLTCRNLPIRYLFIPKCGCTFVKNLIWKLDYGDIYSNQSRIHDVMDEFTRASDLGLSIDQIRREEHGFVVIRNPIDRFLSLYFDKVVGTGFSRYLPLRSTLESHGLYVGASSASEHLRNCMIMIGWIEENLTSVNELPRDAHWTPQHWRGEIIKSFDLKPIPLANLSARLTVLLSDLIPDIGSTLVGMEKYATNSGDRKDAILDAKLRSHINRVYHRDRELYEKVRQKWQTLKPKTAVDIPRFSSFL